MSDNDIKRAVVRLTEAKARYEAERQEKEEADRRARAAAQECGAAAGRRWVYELASYAQFLKLATCRANPNSLGNPQTAFDIPEEVWATLITGGEHDLSIFTAAFVEAACQAWGQIERQLPQSSPIRG